VNSPMSTKQIRADRLWELRLLRISEKASEITIREKLDQV